MSYLAGLIMERMGWTDIWFLGTNRPPSHRRPWHPHQWFVGMWTGPQHDLICAKRCPDSNYEANRYLSPCSYTLMGAILGSLIVYHFPSEPSGSRSTLGEVFKLIGLGKMVSFTGKIRWAR